MRTLKISLIVALLVFVQGIRPRAHADNSFFRVLAAKANVTMEDVVKAFYMLKVDESLDEKMTFAEICDIMTQKKLIRTSYVRDPKVLVNRGQVAFMVCRTLDIRGGLSMRVFGVSERYGYRECVYLKLIPVGVQSDKVSGSELLGILAQAAEYREAHKKSQ